LLSRTAVAANQILSRAQVEILLGGLLRVI